MRDEPAPGDDALTQAFVGRESFRSHVRSALARAASERWSLLVLSDADFVDWPLNDAAVIDALQRWVRHAQGFTLLARRYDEVPRQHARFVEWRRQWAHKIECRICREADPQQLPSALWAPSWALQRTEGIRHTGWCGRDPGRRRRLREDIDGWLARSSAGFPAYTLGL